MLNYRIYKGIVTVLILSFSLSSTTLFAGGPWVKNKGSFFVKLSEWGIIYDQHYTDLGKLDPNLTTGIFNTSLFAEYGLTDRITGIFNGAIFSRNYMNNLRSITTNEILIPGEAINTIGDIDLSLKYGLSKPGARTVMAISVTLGLPTGATGKGTFGNLQTGDGEFNQMIQFDLGRGFSLGNTPAYFSLYTGVNNRTQGYSEEFRYGAELGVGLFSSKLWINSKLNGVKSFKNGETAATVTSTSIFANNTEYVSIGLEANYYITQKLGISANVAGAFAGRIITAAPSYSFGVYYDMQ